MDGAEKDDARRSRFEAVAALVVEPVRRFLARRTDPDTADDVLADTLLVLWRRLDDVPAGDEALPWTYAVARNALANAERGLRRQRRLAHRITVVDPPDEAVPDEPEVDDRVAATFARMRPDEAELLRLWAWEQLGPAEIAAVLGLTPNAVSIRLHRARGRFKEIFEKSGTT
ncbi:RNA polymerase sigma factor [Nocardioides sp.]|uniref:RNA polymerase sigma factor n=1 Tax=Nocardioides sp. TaxID=35761 RepID=UPI001A1FA187|nr:RNA polymerase sigma factor [Nocardioides sp.]MBJ7357371.1 RNA polymerase sigma factor [Nocardioides sp.]